MRVSRLLTTFGITSIGPGGIEIYSGHRCSGSWSRPQSDQEELKFVGHHCLGESRQDLNRTRRN